MRIGVNGRFLAAPLSGVQRFAGEVLTRIAEQADVVLFLPRSAPPPPAALAGRIEIRLGTSAGLLWEQRELRVAADRECDVLLHTANSGSITRVPYVLVLHDVLPLTNPAWFGTAFALWYRALIPRVARSAARIVTVSEWSRREICRVAGTAPGRVLVAPQGIAPFDAPADDCAVRQVRARHDLPERFLLAVGDDRRKNSAFLVRMLAHDAAAPALVVAGTARARVHGRPTLHGGRTGVHLLGRVDDADLHALYTAADVLCFPSLAEGFGRPPLEAAACGTPAIVAPYGAARETLDGLRATRAVPLDTGLWRAAVDAARAAAPELLESDAALVRARWRWDDAAAVVLEACHRAHRATTQRGRVGAAWAAAQVSAPAAGRTVRAVDSTSPAAPAPRVAIVHDWLTGMRGGERVLEHLLRLFPGADIHTLLHVPGTVTGALEERVVATSFVDRLPFAQRAHRFFLPLYPLAAERLDLTGYDVVISSSHCAAKGVRTAAPHLSYCHTPMRYIWDRSDDYRRNGGSGMLVRGGMAVLAPRLRAWDVRTAAHAQTILANSRHVQQRIAQYWHRDAHVVHPPVDVDRFTPASARDDYCVSASALVPYKRVDLAIRAFNRLGRRLLVVGTGPEYARLRALAGPTIEFTGRLSDDEFAVTLARARALIMPMVEDFGIVAVEAQAAGTPVIALARGGALETVYGWTADSPDGATGMFFAEQSVAALAAAVTAADAVDFDTATLRASARRFDAPVFSAAVRAHVAALLRP